ncbi:tetratricopeptide repeat protein [Verrucomicrobiota bacterium]
MEEMEEVVKAYDELIELDIDLPYWVHDAAASAYLFLKDPKKAIELYQIALELKPDRFDTRMGLYHAYVEAGKFGKAEEVLDELKKITPDWIFDRGLNRYNWNKQSIIVEKGWWFAYQDRMKEALKYFRELRTVAPANLSTRTGVAQTSAWRGWPHSAQEDIDIVITMAGKQTYPLAEFEQEREMAAKNARIFALNNNYLKNEAREYGGQLLDRNPKNLHTQRINRQLDIEDSTEFFLDALWTDEDPGAREYYLYTQLIQPVTPLFDLYAYWLRRSISIEEIGDLVEEEEEEHSRAGAGAVWDFLPKLTLKGEVSYDAGTRDNEGFMTRLMYRANDYWTFDAGHSTFSLEVPIRARAAGVEGELTDGSVAFRSSELFEMRAYTGVHELDDGNESYSYGLFAERALITRAAVRTRLFAEAFYTENSETNVPYFSPENTTTFLLEHMLQHTIYRRHDHAFVHRLFFGAGQYDQELFDPEFIWHARYEHDYLFNDKTALLWGVNFRRRFYDAEETDIISWYLTYKQNFW